ncbi:hypothetical protein [Shewanella fodinae]|jgi:hypothetical protein|nr:hypothetical protein [Shewanella fodinae]
MMQYDDLLSRAIARASKRGSIRQAALKIGVTDVHLSRLVRWRETQNFPSNELLFKIAELAGEDKIKSHFAIMAAKLKEPELSTVYERLAS